MSYYTIDEKRLKELLSSEEGEPFMVVFTADWLGEGTIMDTIVEGLADSYDERMGFYRIDVEQSPNITHQLGIRRLPATYIFKDGEMVYHFAGMMSRRNIEVHVNEVL